MDEQKKYIDAEQLLNEIDKRIGYGNPLFYDGLMSAKDVVRIMMLEPADVQPVKRGQWIYDRYGGMWPAGRPRPTQKCDQCGEWHYKDSPYCPECGTYMR